MSADAPILAEPVNDPAPIPSLPGFWNRLDRLIEMLGERFNPILVKETRQAMKSRYFLIAFLLLLFFTWGWSLLGIAMRMPRVYYAPSGPDMLLPYLILLGFPLFVLIPFTAFRSLASEREDGTYELLSISTLSPRQIVQGKLTSAILQMLIYMSALAPCLGFTYLLRGIDVVTIGFFLFYVVFLSVILSATALFLACISPQKVWQSILTVFIIVGLLLFFLIAVLFVMENIVVGASLPLDEPDFWASNLMTVSLGCSVIVLLLTATSARLTFAGANRSTALRVVMLGQALLLIGWFLYWMIKSDSVVGLIGMVSLTSIHWWIMGTFLVGESGSISERMQRRMPRSFLSRMLFTWFLPGPGTGYFFAVGGMTVLVLVVIAVAVIRNDFGLNISGAFSDIEVIIVLAGVFWAYVVLYVGVERLILLGLRRWMEPGLILAACIQILLVLLGTFIPVIVQFSFFYRQGDDYTLLQLPNPFWTLAEIVDNYPTFSSWATASGVHQIVPCILGILALMMLIVQLFVTAPELSRLRPRDASPGEVF